MSQIYSASTAVLRRFDTSNNTPGGKSAPSSRNSTTTAATTTVTIATTSNMSSNERDGHSHSKYGRRRSGRTTGLTTRSSTKGVVSTRSSLLDKDVKLSNTLDGHTSANTSESIIAATATTTTNNISNNTSNNNNSISTRMTRRRGITSTTATTATATATTTATTATESTYKSSSSSSSSDLSSSNVERDNDLVDIVGLDEGDDDTILSSALPATGATDDVSTKLLHERDTPTTVVAASSLPRMAASYFIDDNGDDSELSEVSVTDTEGSQADTTPMSTVTEPIEASKETLSTSSSSSRTGSRTRTITGERRSPRTRRLRSNPYEKLDTTHQASQSDTDSTTTSRQRKRARHPLFNMQTADTTTATTTTTTAELLSTTANYSDSDTSDTRTLGKRRHYSRRYPLNQHNNGHNSSSSSNSKNNNNNDNDDDDDDHDDHDGDDETTTSTRSQLDKTTLKLKRNLDSDIVGDDAAISEMNQLEHLLAITQTRTRNMILDRVEQEIALIHAGTHPALQSQLAPIKQRYEQRMNRVQYKRTCTLENIHAVFDALDNKHGKNLRLINGYYVVR
ncbi:hypothetical protein BDF22DRAFT_774638 [Syncephalis plumigaleata]|nr:hypothetical protein BDF22DRAFT_774638 [Syncephalis plumigaleata]